MHDEQSEEDRLKVMTIMRQLQVASMAKVRFFVLFCFCFVWGLLLLFFLGGRERERCGRMHIHVNGTIAQ